MNNTSAKPQDRFFDSNGVPICYITQGSGPAVVLLHGLTGSVDVWVNNSFFGGPFDGYQLIAMDCRGHGQSGKPHDPAAYGLEMVNDIVRLLDHLEIEKAHIVGHSMGAEIALKMAAQCPTRVRSAVLAGSGWSDDSMYELWGMCAESFERGEGLRAYFEWATPPGQTQTAEEVEGFEQWNQAMLARNDAQAMAALCRNYAELEELRVIEDEVRALQTPLLGVAGEHDAERRMLERMEGVAPDFTLIVLEGLGHGGPVFFEALAREATSFFRRIRPQSGGYMPKIRVNNVTLAYEIFGQGTPVVWTPGGWFPRNTSAYSMYAARLSAHYQVMVWDRRNTGASDIALKEDAPSEYHLWAEDLHHLLHALNLSPAYLGGSSAGHNLSLLMAHRYPEDAKGLILVNTPADDINLSQPLLNAHYLQLAEVAEHKGMQAVIDHSTEVWVRIVSGQSKPEDYDRFVKWIAETVSANPSNRDRLLAMDPKQFAAIMKKWGRVAFFWGSFQLSGLTENQVRGITVPALVAHGFNALHPRHTAEALYRLLPNAEWVEYTNRFTQEEIDRAQETAAQQAALRLPFIEAFLERIEPK